MLTTFLVKIGAVLVGLLSIFGFGWLKGKKSEEVKQTKKDNEIKDKIIEKHVETIKKQQTIQEKDNEIIIDTEKEIKRKRKEYDLGKWLILFAFSFTILSCSKPQVVTIETPCLKPYKLPRPELYNVIIYPNMTLDNETFNKIVENDLRLKSLIKRYESMIDIINSQNNF